METPYILYYSHNLCLRFTGKEREVNEILMKLVYLLLVAEERN